MFQIIRLMLDDHGGILSRWPLHPLYALPADAVAIAEFDASRLLGDYGYDEERDCWWVIDTYGHMYRFIVEQVASADAAA
jgi:hypothetical protein